VNVQIRTMTPIRVAYVRHVGPYQECGKAWEQLCGEAAVRGWFGPATQMIGIGHDEPRVTAADQLRYDACLSVGDEVEPVGGIGVQVIPGGTYAVLTLKGPYDGLAGAYEWLFDTWLPASGKQLRKSPCFEIYRNDPSTTPPAELLTEIYLPLAE